MKKATALTTPVRKTAEYVSPAHPDKLCDQISDAILDECLAQDPTSRVACEVMGGHGQIRITGEITTNAILDYQHCARSILRQNRYNPDDYTINVHVAQQSADIVRGVDTGGAGDQGIMIGYATRETATLIPYELSIARSILQDLRELSPLTRDAKSQVTTQNGKIHTIVLSAERVPNEILSSYLVHRFGTDIIYHINAAGPRTDGGFNADSGLTGRKLAIDNYGPQIPIGGGAFSGKDRSKVDRSGAYMARHLACEYLRTHPSALRAQVAIAYCIGRDQPVMTTITTNTGVYHHESTHDLTPQGIRDTFHLDQPQFLPTAQWGHFGHQYIRE